MLFIAISEQNTLDLGILAYKQFISKRCVEHVELFALGLRNRNRNLGPGWLESPHCLALPWPQVALRPPKKDASVVEPN